MSPEKNKPDVPLALAEQCERLRVTRALTVMGLRSSFEAIEAMARQSCSILAADDLLQTWKERILQKQLKTLALKHHPDRGGDEEIFQEIVRANELLRGLSFYPKEKSVG